MNATGSGKRRLVAGLGAFAVLGAACTGSLLETDMPASTNYVLAPAPFAASTVAATEADLSIGRPDLSPGLDTLRIAVLKGRQLDYYRNVRWGDDATSVVQAFLVDSLEDQRLFRSVTAEQARVAGDYVLDVEVRDFQAEYASETGAPVVHVTMTGRLIRVLDRKLVATVSSEAREQATDDRMAAVVASFEAAGHRVAVELAQKTAAAVAGDEANLRTARGEDGSRDR
jgi:cholesterol transport system auxiliary component